MITSQSGLSNEAISEYATRVGDQHGIYDSNGKADVRRLVGDLGGVIDYSPNKETLHIEHRGKFTIFLPLHTSDRRDRFTMAHELGHYFLHYLYLGLDGPQGFDRGARNRQETEANVFASSLLMPASYFREACRRHGQDWWGIAQQFEVSPSAAEVRAQVLDLAG